MIRLRRRGLRLRRRRIAVQRMHRAEIIVGFRLGLRRQRTRHLARRHLALKFPGGFPRRLAPDIGALHPGRRPRGPGLFGFRRRLHVILFGVIILPQVLWARVLWPQVLWAGLLLTDVRLARVPLPDVWLARLLPRRHRARLSRRACLPERIGLADQPREFCQRITLAAVRTILIAAATLAGAVSSVLISISHRDA
jgi:hypothetical protein